MEENLEEVTDEVLLSYWKAIPFYEGSWKEFHSWGCTMNEAAERLASELDARGLSKKVM